MHLNLEKARMADLIPTLDDILLRMYKYKHPTSEMMAVEEDYEKVYKFCREIKDLRDRIEAYVES